MITDENEKNSSSTRSCRRRLTVTVWLLYPVGQKFSRCRLEHGRKLVMRASFAMFLRFRNGKVAVQRNYDCFAPW